MIRVGQDHLRAGVANLIDCQAFDRPLRSHGHEGRGRDIAVRRTKRSLACLGRRVAMVQSKAEVAHDNGCAAMTRTVLCCCTLAESPPLAKITFVRVRLMSTPLPTAIFLSGSGRTLENLLRQVETQGLPIDIRLVISSAAAVRGVEIARQAKIDTRVVRKSDYADADAYREAMFDPCREVGARWVVMAGFLKHVFIPDDYLGHVVNIHPSLIPAFSGEGMYGIRVHQAAIDRGVQFSGCTVHLVDNHYDHGPIILQRVCAVPMGYNAEQLAATVFELECEALPTALRMIANKSAPCGSQSG